MKREVITQGCRLNLYESGLMRRMMAQANIDNCVIINSCCVTKQAERDSKRAIRKAKKNAPDATIIVTGCAATRNMEEYAKMKEVGIVMDNDAKRQMGSYHEIKKIKNKKAAHILRGEADSWGAFISDIGIDFAGRVRALLAIQRGCDHDCTFCAIPSGRGRSRSLPIKDVIREARTLVAMGYREIVLTGVDITAWGKDLEGAPPLGRLICHLLDKVPSLERLRLSSLDPAEMDEELLAAFEQKNALMPSVHLSIQSGDDMILKRMKRRHSSSQLRELCARLKEARAGMVFGGDIIAGFPTENDAMFENSLNLVSSCSLSFLHVFPYAVRDDTAAARMPSCAAEVIKERARLLRKASKNERMALFAQKCGQRVQILIEKEGYGRDEGGLMVRLDERASIGEIVTVCLKQWQDNYMQGQRI